MFQAVLREKKDWPDSQCGFEVILKQSLSVKKFFALFLDQNFVALSFLFNSLTHACAGGWDVMTTK